MEADSRSSHGEDKPWKRYPKALPQSGKLSLDERAKGDIGTISSDLFVKLFRISRDAEPSEHEVHYVAIAPWRPPLPEPEAKCGWTIVAVRPRRFADAQSIVGLPTTSLALQGIARAFQDERPDIKSLRGVEILVVEVQPLTLQTIFVQLDGDALSKHAEVQQRFAGGFLPTRNGASTTKGPRIGSVTISKSASRSHSELSDQLEGQVVSAVCESLSKPTVIRCKDVYALPLPTHPITHASFPPIEVTICEPVDQGLVSGQTEVIVDVHQKRRKSHASVLDQARQLDRLTSREDEDSSAEAFESARENANGSNSAPPRNGANESESLTETSESEEESSSEESDDNAISLSTTILPIRASGLASPESASTPQTGRRQRSGATSPVSVYSSLTATTANQRSLQGKLYHLKALVSRVPDYILHPQPNNEEDDEARLFMDVKMLARVGCFSGDWVRISTTNQLNDEKGHTWSLENFGREEAAGKTRTVKVYGLPGLQHAIPVLQDDSAVRSEKPDLNRRMSQSSAISISRAFPTAFVSPVLYTNLGQPDRIYVAPIRLTSENNGKMLRRRMASSALLPTAKEVTLLRMPTPLSTEKVMQPGILANLKDYFERRRRIVKAGDRVAVTFEINASRIVASLSPKGEPDRNFESLLVRRPEDGWMPKGPVGVAWFEIGQVSGSRGDKDSESADPAVWNGAVSVEPMHTKMMQAGSESAKVPFGMDNPWELYLGVKSLPPSTLERPSAFRIPDAMSNPFVSYTRRRLRQLLGASTSPQAREFQIKPLVILLHSTQRDAGKIYTASTACADLGLHSFRIDAYDILTEGGDGSDVKTEGALRAKIDRALTCGETLTVPVIRHVEALAADRMATAFEEILQDVRALVLTTIDISKVSDGIRGLVTHELEISAPDENARKGILQSAINDRGVGTAPDVDLAAIARKTAAMAAGGLVSIIERAIIARRMRLSETSRSQPRTLVRDILVSGGAAARSLTTADLDRAVDAARKSFSDAIGAPKIPHVSWDDVGGLAHAKHAILETIRLPLEHPELFARGLKKRSGILLYGPPGTGKTLLAKAIATSFSLNFFSVKGPELLNMYIGESEANVRRVFARARDARPCVVFFDELDAVAPKRGNQGDSGGVMDRIVSQLLAELDGMSDGKRGGDAKGDGEEQGGSDDGFGVFVVGATNRPDLLDPALLRPGRFDKMLYLGVAETHEQQQRILEALTRKFVLAEGLSLARVAERLPFTYTGADLYALCADAMLKSMMRQAHAVDEKIRALPGERITPAQFFDRHATEEDIEVVVTEEDFRAAQGQLVTSVRFVLLCRRHRPNLGRETDAAQCQGA